MSTKLHIKKGDTVFVNTGEDKGKTGRALEVRPKVQLAIGDRFNMVSIHSKPSAKNPQGGIIKQEAAIHISNHQVVDPSKGGPARIGRRLNAQGKLVRYAKKSGEEIK